MISRHSEPRQVDLEEYIAEQMGEGYVPRVLTRVATRDELNDFETLATMYAPLRSVLDAAYSQASSGKGRDRHANGKPFIDQPIMEIGRMVGMGYQTGQAMKKAQEAGGMAKRGQYEAARAELLGAINYLAAAHILLVEIEGKQDVDFDSKRSL